MSRTRKSAELLPILTAAYPQIFFADPAQVQPLKVGIDKDLLTALPAGIKPIEAKRLLYWYVNRAGYLRALLHGRPRIDLAGAVVESEIPDEIREQARERWLQLRAARQNPKSGKPTGPRPAAKPGPSRPAAPATVINVEELYAMAIDAKLEITLKFSTLPNAKPAGQGKMAFALKTLDGQFVAVELNNKAWNKLLTANTDWPSWIAALSGTMGPRTEKGFMLSGPGLQVFEKKAKADTATPVTDTASAEPVPTPAPAPPPSTPPVTVRTGAGKATITVTKRAPLSLKR